MNRIHEQKDPLKSATTNAQSNRKEIADHEKQSYWSILTRSTLPKSAKPIKVIWPFKRKRKPDGELLKQKARLCAHGGMQRWGNNYWDTYSPVVNRLSVCLILAIPKCTSYIMC